MTLKKSKSNLKKSSKITEYKNIQADIIDYAGRHHFYETITHMLYGAYNEKSEDPYAFMINYLIEKRGSKSENYGNQQLLTEIQEKDEEIKRLNDRITYLESLNNEANTQAVINSQLIENDSFMNNVSLSTTLSGFSELAENPSFMKGIEFNLVDSSQAAMSSESPMMSYKDVTVLIPTIENPSKQQQQANDLILTFNFNRLKSEQPATLETTLKNNQSSEESLTSNDSDEIAMDVSDSEVNEKSIKEDVKITEKSVKEKISEKSVTPINNFDDFEPDYEPDDE